MAQSRRAGKKPSTPSRMLPASAVRRSPSAYQDRASAGFKKTVIQLAWDSFAWFVSEPDHIIILRDGGQSAARLVELIGTAS